MITTKMSISKIVATLLVVGVAIQFIPYGKDHTNPPETSEPKWDSPQTKALFDRACASCHSNKTKWPKYSNYAPISWLITHDVNEGREKLNVSEWNKQNIKIAKKAPHEIKEGDMPPLIYLPMHPEAKLSDKEKEALIKGLKTTFK